MNYGDILEKTWKIIWKHKILWLFGVLAGCGAAGSGGGSGGGAGSSSNFTAQPPSLDFMGNGTVQAFEDIGRFITSIPVFVWIWLVITLISVGFILSVIFFLVGALGQTGVIKGASLADQADVEDSPLSLSTLFNALKPHYWKVVLLNLAVVVIGLIGGVFLIVPIFIITICTCFVGPILFMIIGWFINVLVNFIMIAIIEEDLGIIEAVGRAWRVLTRNLGRVVVMFLILGIGSIIITIIIGLPALIIPVPLVVNLIITGAESFVVGLIISVFLSLIIMPLIIFLSGVLQAYILSAWTLTFRRLTQDNGFEPTVLDGSVDED